MKLCISLVAGALALIGGVRAADMQMDAGLEEEMAREFQGSRLMGREISNLMSFTGALGGVTPEPITKSNDKTKPFEVNGNTFGSFDEAFQRSCDDQKNACADVANSKNNPASIKVSQCETQASSCLSATATATQTGFNVLTSSNAEFDFFCDF
ncbi:hypothetical protein ACMFMG_001220 [Clarireedia jacksonii]